MDYSNEELAVIRKAAASVGGLNDMAPKQLQRFASVAHEEQESRKPLVSRPVINKAAQPDAMKAEVRIAKLQEVRDTPSFSPSLRRFAARELALIARGKDVDAAEQDIVKSVIEELEDSREQGKILARLYETATDDPTRRAVKAAQKRHFDASTATVKEIATRHLKRG